MGRERIDVRVGRALLHAELVAPEHARGVVVDAGFADAIDRDRLLAEHLARMEIATLSLPLLTEDEQAREASSLLRFEVPLLAQRIAVAVDWVLAHAELRYVPVVLSASNTAAAAALLTASGRTDVRAVVARDGRPDLAGAALERVRVPAYLVVADDDDERVALNRSSRARLRASELVTVARDAVTARVAELVARELAR